MLTNSRAIAQAALKRVRNLEGSAEMVTSDIAQEIVKEIPNADITGSHTDYVITVDISEAIDLAMEKYNISPQLICSHVSTMLAIASGKEDDRFITAVCKDNHVIIHVRENAPSTSHQRFSGLWMPGPSGFYSM